MGLFESCIHRLCFNSGKWLLIQIPLTLTRTFLASTYYSHILYFCTPSRLLCTLWLFTSPSKLFEVRTKIWQYHRNINFPIFRNLASPIFTPTLLLCPLFSKDRIGDLLYHELVALLTVVLSRPVSRLHGSLAGIVALS